MSEQKIKIEEIAERIRGLRGMVDISTAKMAEILGMSEEEYIAHEAGQRDFAFSFLYQCAKEFGVDITEILTGDVPKLSFFEVARKNEGLPIARRKGFSYQHLAYLFKNKVSEPFLVVAPYSEDEENKPLKLSTHEGQEFDYILSGSLKVEFEGGHTVVLGKGDSIYYDSGHGHGMTAVGGKDCTLLAVVMNKQEEKTNG